MADVVSGTVPGFLPSVQGFHFPNAFPHEPLAGVSIPGLGPVSIGDAADGLCGGMVFSVLDLLAVATLPPSDTDPPAAGTPQFRYLVRRLVDSFDLPAGPGRYLALMSPLVPDGPSPLAAVGVRSRTQVMVEDAWPAIRADIDHGRPSPLGLVRVVSADPRDLGHDHQVLAYRYTLSGSALAIGVYDPNHPDDDDITIALDTADADAAASVVYSAGDGPVHCFFRTAYTAAIPGPFMETEGGT
ncbi:MAG TPA: hypothetical protein VF763_03465 [Candidatus Limnocylindrales bacterium]